MYPSLIDLLQEQRRHYFRPPTAGAARQSLVCGFSLSFDRVRNLRSVYFVDAITGWAAGMGGTILKTTNGGTQWNEAVVIHP